MVGRISNRAVCNLQCFSLLRQSSPNVNCCLRSSHAYVIINEHFEITVGNLIPRYEPSISNIWPVLQMFLDDRATKMLHIMKQLTVRFIETYVVHTNRCLAQRDESNLPKRLVKQMTYWSAAQNNKTGNMEAWTVKYQIDSPILSILPILKVLPKISWNEDNGICFI